MKKIAWVTPEYFVETDIYIVPLLCDTYTIEWHIISRSKTGFENDLKQLSKTKNLKIVNDVTPYRERSLKKLGAFWKIFKGIKESKPDYLYIGLNGYPYALPLINLILRGIKTVVPVHNVNTPKGAVNYHFAKWNTKRILNTYTNFQTFSESQYNLLKSLKPRKNVFYTPFLLKNYGEPTVGTNDKITFLNFGIIRDYKRLDVLIEAAQAAYEETKIEFLVVIAGGCTDWDKYQKLIRYPQLFDLRIKRLENDEIPNLFGYCHYFVAPYQDIAQSGAVVVAINYDKPIIASDLEAFREYIKNGMNGYLMRPASVEDLTHIMVEILRNHDDKYNLMVTKLKEMKKEKFSVPAIKQKYVNMFENLR